MTDEELQRYLTMPVAEFTGSSSSSPPEYDTVDWEDYIEVISSLFSKH